MEKEKYKLKREEFDPDGDFSLSIYPIYSPLPDYQLLIVREDGEKVLVCMADLEYMSTLYFTGDEDFHCDFYKESCDLYFKILDDGIFPVNHERSSFYREIRGIKLKDLESK